MTIPFKKIENGAYLVLNTFYALRGVGYDSRVANQSLLGSICEAEDEGDEENPQLPLPEAD